MEYELRNSDGKLVGTAYVKQAVGINEVVLELSGEVSQAWALTEMSKAAGESVDSPDDTVLILSS